MGPRGVLRVQGTWRNESVAERVVVGRPVVVVVVVVAVVKVAVDQAVIHIDMVNYMTDMNCTAKMIVELAVVEHLNKVMAVAVAAD